MKRKAVFYMRGTWTLSLVLFPVLLAGCPDPNPNPDPDPVPVAPVNFRIPQSLQSDQGPDSVASALLNMDAFPDVVTANREDNTLSLWIAAGANGFPAAQRLLTGGTDPRAVLLHDITGEGAIDIVSANSGSDNLSLLLGTGNGTFQIATQIALPEGAAPRDVAALDANGDGRVDLVSANSGLNSISLLLADDAGGFAEPLSFPTGAGPRAVLAVDINNDDRVDIVTADRDANALSLFINDADGTLLPAVSLACGANPRMILAKDLDNDGWIDLVISNTGDSTVSVHMGAGNGTLETPVFIPLNAIPTRMAMGDFTGDGIDDLMIILFDGQNDLYSSGQIQCLAGDGRGDFDPHTTYFARPGVAALVGVDLNRDGEDDLAVCNIAEDRLLIAAGSRTAGLAMERRFAVGNNPRMVVTADFNRDNHADLAVANLDSANVTVLLGDGAGNFEAETDILVGDAARALAAADLNGDNRVDLVVTNLNQSRVAVLLGQGNGRFATAVFYSVREGDTAGTAQPRSITIADVNKDTFPDLVVGNAARDSVAVLLGDGNGVFGAAKEFAAGNFPLDVQLADLNKDGKLDLVLVNGVDAEGVASPASVLRVIPGKGDGTFDVANDVGYVSSAGPGSLVVRDLDRDGDLDVATCHRSLDTLQIYAGRGDGMFSAGGLVGTGDAPNAVGAADINGDGRPDLFTTNDGGTMTFRPHRSGLFYNLAVTVPVGNRPIEAIVVDINGDNRPDIVAPNRETNDVSIILGSAS